MRKKNKRKEPEFKKPFIVLSRRKIAGWFLLIFFLCAWMFILGILVGRGTAPVKFDIAAIEKKLEALKKDNGGDQGKERAQKESVTVKDKTKLEFYEALKENKVDTNVPALQKPKVVERKIEKPADKTVSKKAQKKKPTKEKGKDAAVARTNAAGPIYTIQAASVKDPKDADQLVQKLKKRGYPAYRVIGKIPGKGIWFRVRIGTYKSKSEALGVMSKLKKDGLKPILVLR
jgi:cell division septation protein DedD